MPVARSASQSSNRKPTQLGEDLERAVVHALLLGKASLDCVRPEELSKSGRAVLDALRNLTHPTPEAVLLHCSEVQGYPKEVIKDYLAAVSLLGARVDVAEILQQVHAKQTLVELINEASTQLSRGVLDLGAFSPILTGGTNAVGNRLVSVSEAVKNGLPAPLAGLPLKSLPNLSRTGGGFIGMWAVAGEPGVGKSVLAMQISLDLGSRIPVLYYDYENGFDATMDRIREVFHGDLERIRAATARLYYRDSVRSLESDLSLVAPPALIVVDSVQKLPVNMQYARMGLDRWVHRFEALKKRGYNVLLVSEVGRAHYNSEASLASFKESGEIEYSADLGFQLLPNSEDIAEVHIVKNRHRPRKGMVGLLQRRGWLWKELGQDADNVEPEVLTATSSAPPTTVAARRALD